MECFRCGRTYAPSPARSYCPPQAEHPHPVVLASRTYQLVPGDDPAEPAGRGFMVPEGEESKWLS